MQAMQVFSAGSRGYEAIPGDDEATDGYDYANGMEQTFRRKRPRPWRSYAAVGVGALGLAAVVGLVGHRVGRVASSYTQSSSDVAAWEAADAWNTSLEFDLTNEYPPVSTLYPWRIVEPHRATTLTAVSGLNSQSGEAGGSGQRYTWEVTLGGQSLLPNATLVAGAASVVYVFERPAKEYMVTLTEESVGRKGELHVRSITGMVMCKYVRREIRQLTSEDRQAYFEAMDVVAKTDMETGVETYGERFVNLQYMTKKHLYGDACTPYHSGNSFFTAHAAFTLQLDQALRLIEPTACTPYWDYTIDDDLYGHHWEKSVVWDDSWFGALDTQNRNHELEGRFAGTSYPPRDFNFSEHNAYGILTKRTNVDPNMLTTRAHQFCDLPIDLTLPGCSIVSECLATNDLTSLHHCAEDELHGNIHNVIGGFFGCPVSLGKFGEAHPEYRNLLMNMGEVASTMWSNDPHIEWPTYCANDTQFETCRARCTNITMEVLDEMDSDELYLLMHRHNLAYFGNSSDRSTFDSPMYNSYFDISWTGDGEEGEGEGEYEWTFKPRHDMVLNSTLNDQLMRFSINFGCNPGKYGTMSTGSATNDPVFWPIHPFFDRLWHFIRLDEGFEHFNHTWEDSSNCSGRGWYDELPFTDLFGESENEQEDAVASPEYPRPSVSGAAGYADYTDGEGGRRLGGVTTHTPARGAAREGQGEWYYTNADLYSLFDPRNPKLEYVYDNFEAPHCEADDDSGAAAESEVSEESEESGDDAEVARRRRALRRDRR